MKRAVSVYSSREDEEIENRERLLLFPV